jgi:hypothetical protein
MTAVGSKPVDGAVPLILELRIANHSTVLGEICHRVIALEREALVARLRNCAGSEQ